MSLRHLLTANSSATSSGPPGTSTTPLIANGHVAAGHTANGHATTLPTPARTRAIRQLRTRSALSPYFDRQSFAQVAGRSFVPQGSATAKRDTYEALGYLRTLSIADHRARYLRGGLASAIINAYPRATWKDFTVVDDSDPETLTPFESSFTALSTRLGLKSLLRRADTLARLTEFSLLVVSVASTQRGDTDLKTPLAPSTLSDESQVVRIWCYGSDAVNIDSWDEDPNSPRFGLPEVYSIGHDASTSTFNATTGTHRRPTTHFEVHHSRCVHIVCDTLDDEVTSAPMLTPGWNRLDDEDPVGVGGSEAAWTLAKPGLLIGAKDPSRPMSPEDEDEVIDQVDEYEHNLRRFLLLHNIDATLLTGRVADFSKNSDVILRDLGGTYRIPVRILTGSERGELASSQDANDWAERISETRSEYADPCILRPLIDWLLTAGALPSPTNPQWTIDWPTRSKNNDTELSEIALNLAKANAAMIGSTGQAIMSSAQIGERFFGLSPDDMPPEPTQPNNSDADSPSSDA